PHPGPLPQGEGTNTKNDNAVVVLLVPWPDALTLALYPRVRVQTLKKTTPLPFCFYLAGIKKPGKCPVFKFNV
ncbi:hypothetical protein ABG794_17700, partial [Enterobacter soli]|uniref:hypothetical protein n=1 Tax=Enterobacter soli TaxID=885040 RepID=UPI00325A81D0